LFEELKSQIENNKTNMICDKCKRSIYIGDWIMLAIQVKKKQYGLEEMTAELFSYVHVNCPKSKLKLDIT